MYKCKLQQELMLWQYNELKETKINIKMDLENWIFLKHFILKLWDISTILWPTQLVLGANLFGFLETPLLC